MSQAPRVRVKDHLDCCAVRVAIGHSMPLFGDVALAFLCRELSSAMLAAAWLLLWQAVVQKNSGGLCGDRKIQEHS